ncbi:MAG TPA: hypothetical protein VKY74_28025 [Chloroflexia bacterium]|nr:hypothetical protein [Chloroflexia bacterium]
MQPTIPPATALPSDPVADYLMQGITAQPEPPRPAPLGPLLWLAARAYWWALLPLGFFCVVLIQILTPLLAGSALSEMDLFMGAGGILLIAVFAWLPLAPMVQLATMRRTGRRVPATVLAILTRNSAAPPTDPPTPISEALLQIAVESPDLGRFVDTLVVGPPLAAQLTPGARIEVLASCRRPIAWCGLGLLAPAPPAEAGAGAPLPRAPIPARHDPGAPAAAAAAWDDPLGAHLERILAQQPQPPRVVPAGALWRVILGLDASIGVLIIGGLLLVGTLLLVRQLAAIGSQHVLGDWVIAGGLGLAIALGLLLMPLALARRVATALRTGIYAEATILSVAYGPDARFNTPPVPGQRPIRRTGGSYDPMILDVWENGRAVGRWRVAGPGRVFEESFLVDRVWARRLARGRHLGVLVDPARDRVLLATSLRPVAEDVIFRARGTLGRAWVLVPGVISVLFLGMAGRDGWLQGQISAHAARYPTAPICGPAGGPNCRALQPATIVAIQQTPAKSGPQYSVTVRIADRGTQELIDRGRDLCQCSATELAQRRQDLVVHLTPGMTMQAEYWDGEVTLLRGDEGRVLIAPGYPAFRAPEQAAGAWLWGMVGGIMLLITLGLASERRKRNRGQITV